MGYCSGFTIFGFEIERQAFITHADLQALRHSFEFDSELAFFGRFKRIDQQCSDGGFYSRCDGICFRVGKVELGGNVRGKSSDQRGIAGVIGDDKTGLFTYCRHLIVLLEQLGRNTYEEEDDDFLEA